jgi:ATP-dependent Lhr-like helicase
LFPVPDEYCDRRLLARIHRYTLDRLRREIDPVSAQDYMRFLLRWQHLAPDTRLTGKTGVKQAIARLQGFEAAAGAWERDLLAARVSDYRSSWLDELCLAGEVAWARLTPRKVTPTTTSATASRATPVSLCLRPELEPLLIGVRLNSPFQGGPKAGAAAEIHELLNRRGALFFDEIVNATRRLRSDVERGLRELVAWGLVTSDGFQGLRQLSSSAPSVGRRRGRDASNYAAGGFFVGSGPAGRWALIPSPSSAHPEVLESRGAVTADHPSASSPPSEPALSQGVGSTERGLGGEVATDMEDLAEAVARVLLQRYGVVFRDLYPRESFTVPWRDLLRALRRLEARGIVRGGRFVSGFNGEQYALPEAVDGLRWVRRQERTGERVWVAAVDVANLLGVVIPGDKIPAQQGKGLLFVDGLPQTTEMPPTAKTPVPSRLTPVRR